MESCRRLNGDPTMFAQRVAIGLILIAACLQGGGGSTAASDELGEPTSDSSPASTRPASEASVDGGTLRVAALASDSSSPTTVAAAAAAASVSAAHAPSSHESATVGGDVSEAGMLDNSTAAGLEGGVPETTTRLSAEPEPTPTNSEDDVGGHNESLGSTVSARRVGITASGTLSDSSGGSDTAALFHNASVHGHELTIPGDILSEAPGTEPYRAATLHASASAAVQGASASAAAQGDEWPTGSSSSGPRSYISQGSTYFSLGNEQFETATQTAAIDIRSSDLLEVSNFNDEAATTLQHTQSTRSDSSDTTFRYDQRTESTQSYTEDDQLATSPAILGGATRFLDGTTQIYATESGATANRAGPTESDVWPISGTDSSDSTPGASLWDPTASERQTVEPELWSDRVSHQDNTANVEAHVTATMSYSYDATTGQSNLHSDSTVTYELLATERDDATTGQSNLNSDSTVTYELLATERDDATTGESNLNSDSTATYELLATERDDATTGQSNLNSDSTVTYELLATERSSGFIDEESSDFTSGAGGNSTVVPEEAETRVVPEDYSGDTPPSTNRYESVITRGEATTDGSYAELGTWSQPQAPSGATEAAPSDVPGIAETHVTTADYSDDPDSSVSQYEAEITGNDIPTQGSYTEISIWSQLWTRSGTDEPALTDFSLTTSEEQSNDVTTAPEFAVLSHTVQSMYNPTSSAPETENLPSLTDSASTATLTESLVSSLEDTTAVFRTETVSHGPSINDAAVIEERRNNSVVVSLSMTLKMYTKEFDRRFRQTIADAANEYCKSASCQADSAGSRVRRAALAATYAPASSGGGSATALAFTAADVGILPGYPAKNNASGIDIATYLSSAVSSGGAAGICISGEILLAVLVRGQANISTSLGVAVLSVVKLVQTNDTAAPATHATAAQRSSPSPESSEWMTITAALLTLVVLVVSVAAGVVAFKKWKRKASASVTPSITKLNREADEQASTSASSADMWYVNPPASVPIASNNRRLRDLERSSTDLWYAESMPKEPPTGRHRVYRIASEDMLPEQRRPLEDFAHLHNIKPLPAYSVLPPIR